MARFPFVNYRSEAARTYAMRSEKLVTVVTIVARLRLSGLLVIFGLRRPTSMEHSRVCDATIERKTASPLSLVSQRHRALRATRGSSFSTSRRGQYRGDKLTEASIDAPASRLFYWSFTGRRCFFYSPQRRRESPTG